MDTPELPVEEFGSIIEPGSNVGMVEMQGFAAKSQAGGRRQLGYVYNVKIGECHFYLITRNYMNPIMMQNGFYPESLAGIDVFASKVGSTLYGLLRTLTTGFNAALQTRPLHLILSNYIGEVYEPNGPTNDPDIPTCTSISDYIARRLMLDYCPVDVP